MNAATILPTLTAVAAGNVRGASSSEKEMAAATVGLAMAAVGRMEAGAGGAERVVECAEALVAALKRAIAQVFGQDRLLVRTRPPPPCGRPLVRRGEGDGRR